MLHAKSRKISSRFEILKCKQLTWGIILKWSISILALATLFVLVYFFILQDEPVALEEQYQDDVPLPADEALPSLDFDLAAGDSIVVALDIDTMLQTTTGNRRGAYVNFGIACAALHDDASSQSATGTQNLRYQDGAGLRTQFVYTAEHSGPQRCNANFRAPNWDPDYGDATVELAAEFQAREWPEAAVEQASPSSNDPIVPVAGETETVIDHTVPIDDDTTWIEASATSHLTTCSIEAGSRDQTEENLCTPGLIDRDGSSVRVRSAVEVVNDGEVCDSFTIQDEEIHISHHVHHLVDATEPERLELDTPVCGDELRLVQRIENDGPAAVVAHRGSSNVIVISG